MKNKIFACAYFLIVLFGWYSCSSGSHKNSSSFCYWDTVYKMDTALCREYGVTHFYLRYFDVGWDESTLSARPIATLSVRDSLPGNFTPVIYLTNTVFEKSDPTAIDSLARRVARRIKMVDSDFVNVLQSGSGISWNDTVQIKKLHQKFYKKYESILIDCDWTESTRDKFFAFIGFIKKAIPDKKIEATLRLWQYKYRDRAGIPPVNRCLLMCYNMQMANNYNVTNSIASLDELKKYIVGKRYPLQLDVALPVFNWAVLFRNQKSVGIIGNADSKTFEADIENFKATGLNRYTLLNDRVIGGFYARQGDEVRVEHVTPKELQKIAAFLGQQLDADSTRKVAFFAWNKSYLKNYQTNELDEVVTALAR